MFRRPTTFILGAGASWHYGYPTGEGLISKVVQVANELAVFFKESARGSDELPKFIDIRQRDSQTVKQAWLQQAHCASALANRLTASNPTLIDYFLKQNEELREIGKLAIALVIFRCEEVSKLGSFNPNRREIFARQADRGERTGVPNLFRPEAFNDDWLRFVLHKLTVGCAESYDLLRNSVNFVTFNYDTSLEHRLWKGLSSNSFFKAEDVMAFFEGGERFIHVYGALRQTAPSNELVNTMNLPADIRDKAGLQMAKAMLDTVYEASLGLRTIDGDDKEAENHALGLGASRLSEAQRIYILGYGFDETNSQRLRIRDAIDQGGRQGIDIMFTNFLGLNRVSKAAGRLFGADPRTFLPPNTPIQRLAVGGTNWRMCEMSTKNVYDALEQDFESLEHS